MLFPHGVPPVYASILLTLYAPEGRDQNQVSLSPLSKRVMSQCHFMSFCCPSWAALQGAYTTDFLHGPQETQAMGLRQGWVGKEQLLIPTIPCNWNLTAKISCASELLTLKYLPFQTH